MNDRAHERRQELAALAALLLFVAGRCLVPMDETDLFFNLRLGDLILAHHAVPRTNLLSFTAPMRAISNLAWLFQIVLALAYRAGGIAGTVLLKTTFVLATWALLFRVALRRGAHPAAAAAALALAAWAAEPRFVERPHLCTFLGLAISCWRSSAPRSGGRARSPRWCRWRSSGPTRTPASSWPRPCSPSTRPAPTFD